MGTGPSGTAGMSLCLWDVPELLPGLSEPVLCWATGKMHFGALHPMKRSLKASPGGNKAGKGCKVHLYERLRTPGLSELQEMGLRICPVARCGFPSRAVAQSRP